MAEGAKALAIGETRKEKRCFLRCLLHRLNVSKLAGGLV